MFCSFFSNVVPFKDFCPLRQKLFRRPCLHCVEYRIGLHAFTVFSCLANFFTRNRLKAVEEAYRSQYMFDKLNTISFMKSVIVFVKSLFCFSAVKRSGNFKNAVKHSAANKGFCALSPICWFSKLRQVSILLLFFFCRMLVKPPREAEVSLSLTSQSNAPEANADAHPSLFRLR